MSSAPQSPQQTGPQYAAPQYGGAQHGGPHADSPYAESPYAGTQYGNAYAAPPPAGGTGRRIGVTLGIVFSLLLVAAGALWLAAVLVRQDETRSTTVSEPFSSVVIDTGSGDVHLQAADTPGALVEQRLRWSFSEPTVTTTVDDGVLSIRADCRSIDFGLGCSITLTVHVPAGTPATIDTGSGDIDVWGLDADVALKTGSGDIALLDVDGAVQTRTGSGDISLDGVIAGAVAASTGSGDIEVSLDSDPDEVTLRAGSGDVDLWLPQGDAAYDVDVSTGSGDRRVDVRTDPSSSRSISARTGSGDVTIAYG